MPSDKRTKGLLVVVTAESKNLRGGQTCFWHSDVNMQLVTRVPPKVSRHVVTVRHCPTFRVIVANKIFAAYKRRWLSITYGAAT